MWATVSVNVIFTQQSWYNSEPDETLHCDNISASVDLLQASSQCKLCLTNFAIAQLLVHEGLLCIMFYCPVQLKNNFCFRKQWHVPQVPILALNSFTYKYGMKEQKYKVVCSWSNDAFVKRPRFLMEQLYVVYIWARRMRINLYRDLRQLLCKYLMDDLHREMMQVK